MGLCGKARRSDGFDAPKIGTPLRYAFPYGKNDLRNIFYRSDKKYDAKANR